MHPVKTAYGNIAAFKFESPRRPALVRKEAGKICASSGERRRPGAQPVVKRFVSDQINF
jgi:hypothetical protein